MEPKEKSLEELRAAINQDQESKDDTGTQDDGKSKEEQDASSKDEGTSTDASEVDPTEGTSKEDDKWVVPGRFRTQADVLKAYQELESFTGRQSSEIQKLRTAIVEPPRRGESEEEKTARLKRFADELTQDPEAALELRMRKIVNEVKGDVRASEFKRAYDERKKNSEFAELEPIMTELATQYGDMITNNGMQNDPRLLDILHLAARGIKAAEVVKKAEALGIEKGKETSRQKNKARVEGPSSTSKGKKLDISKLSASEMKAALQKGDLAMDE